MPPPYHLYVDGCLQFNLIQTNTVQSNALYVTQYDDNAGERSILLFHVHVFVETRLRWHDDDDYYYGDGGGGNGGKDKSKDKTKGWSKGKGKNRGHGLRCEHSAYGDDERLLSLFVPRDGHEYFPPHMIVYQHA